MCVLKLADLRTVATETISIEAMVLGHHVYQDSWDSAIRPCTRKPGNCKDPFTVAVVIKCYRQSCAKEDIECVLHVCVVQFTVE